MRAIRIFLLVLIIIGIGLLITQKTWVPKIVDYILKSEVVSPEPILPISIPTPVSRPGKVDTGVEGIVTIGPTCPVVRVPDDGTCADKPYQTSLIIEGNIIGKNGGILVSTDSKGYFSKELVPGTYTIRAQADVVMPRLSPVTFTIKLHERASLNLEFDSGIR